VLSLLWRSTAKYSSGSAITTAMAAATSLDPAVREVAEGTSLF